MRRFLRSARLPNDANVRVVAVSLADGKGPFFGPKATFSDSIGAAF